MSRATPGKVAQSPIFHADSHCADLGLDTQEVLKKRELHVLS
jgi:hypothetical protein